MITYESVVKKPKDFLRFFGVSVEVFGELLVFAEANYPAFNEGRRKDRVNTVGGGRHHTLCLADRLLMFLLYYRQYITESLAGLLFGLHESNVSRNQSVLAPLMKKCLPTPSKVYRQARKANTIEELLLFFPESKAFIDATEQEIPRPCHKRRRKNYYSGKKKKHTVKTQVMVNQKGLILHASRHVKGSKHDLQLYREQHPKIPPNVEAGMDLGYYGIAKDFPDLKVKLPEKKKKGGILTPKQKRNNKRHSKHRVIVENTLCKIKKFSIIGEEYRNKQDRYYTTFSIAAGLVNLQTMHKQKMSIQTFIR